MNPTAKLSSGHRSEPEHRDAGVWRAQRRRKGESNDSPKGKTLSPSSYDALDKFVKRRNFGVFLDNLLERKIQKYLNDESDCHDIFGSGLQLDRVYVQLLQTDGGPFTADVNRPELPYMDPVYLRHLP